jgi:hypothetical protein
MKLFTKLSYQSWSIASKIAIAMILSVILPMAISTYFNLRQITTISTNSAYRQVELLASQAAQRFDRLLLDRQHLAETISWRMDVAQYIAAPQTAAPVLPQLTEIVAAHQDLEAILLLDRAGRCLTATVPQFIGRIYSLPDREVFSRLHSNVWDYPGMFVAHRLGAGASVQSGAVLLKLRGVEVWSAVNRGISPQTAGRFFLADDQGRIISHPQLSLLYQKMVDTVPDWLHILDTKSSGYLTYRPSPSRMSQIIGFTTLSTQPWVLGVSQSQAEFQAPLTDITWLNLQGVISVGIIAALTALFLGICISRPIQGLTIAAQSLGQDNEASVEQMHQDLAEFAATPDDLGQLVRAFLKMADELHRRSRQLKTQMQSLRIEIDRTWRDRDVAEITDNERFQQLQLKIQQLRKHERNGAETETDYFQRLQQQVQSLKERV